MAVIHLIRVEVEARRLIARARRTERMAARWRGEHLCLPCKLHLCHIPLWAIRGACVLTLAADLFGLHQLGAF